MARAVAPLPKRRKIKCALPSYGFTNLSSVKKFTPTKKAPGSVTCAHTNNNTTQTVIRMQRPFMTNLNRLSCSIWLNSIGWRKIRMRERSNHCSPWTAETSWWRWGWWRSTEQGWPSTLNWTLRLQPQGAVGVQRLGSIGRQNTESENITHGKEQQTVTEENGWQKIKEFWKKLWAS